MAQLGGEQPLRLWQVTGTASFTTVAWGRDPAAINRAVDQSIESIAPTWPHWTLRVSPLSDETIEAMTEGVDGMAMDERPWTTEDSELTLKQCREILLERIEAKRKAERVANNGQLDLPGVDSA